MSKDNVCAILLILLICRTTTVDNKVRIYSVAPSLEKQKVDMSLPVTKIKFTEKNVDKAEPAMVLAGIANYECGSLSAYERWLVMEAMYNRVTINFNKNGSTLKAQIFAHRQIGNLSTTGRNSRFYFNSQDKLHVANYLMALSIISGNRQFPDEPILYWANPTDHHRQWVKKNKVKTTQRTKHIFCKQP